MFSNFGDMCGCSEILGDSQLKTKASFVKEKASGMVGICRSPIRAAPVRLGFNRKIFSMCSTDKHRCCLLVLGLGL